MANQLMSTAEVAERLGIVPTSVVRMIDNRLLGAIRVGKNWKIPPKELDAFIERNTVRAEVECNQPPPDGSKT